MTTQKVSARSSLVESYVERLVLPVENGNMVAWYLVAHIAPVACC